MTAQKRAEALAEEFKQLVFARTGLTPPQLVCPREKSDMTPCAARDGWMVAVLDLWQRPLCVGCEASLERLLAEERAKVAR